MKPASLFMAGWMLLSIVAPAGASELCPAEQTTPQIPTDIALCERLEPVIRRPGALPLAEYEARMGEFMQNWCHRREASGWRPDKTIRDTGPYIATQQNGRWTGAYLGTHSPVVIWYSPDMLEWVRTQRAHPDAVHTSPEAEVPDGAIMVKELYPRPAAACRDIPFDRLRPTSGAAIMVRAKAASHDGWFWGYYSWNGSTPDWPAAAGNGLPAMGFGQTCITCHASAREHSTFANLGNIKDEPGTYLTFLIQDFWQRSTLAAPGGPSREARDPTLQYHADATAPAPRSAAAWSKDVKNYLAALGLPRVPTPDVGGVVPMPSATYDNVFVPAGGPGPHNQFQTSDQCVSCHSAAGAELQFDMTAPGPGGKLFNLSPYATWRSSPMGLAGRDPMFFAQLASEVDTFHPASAPMVQDTCLGCHGVQGQRQFGIDQTLRSGVGTGVAAGAACTPFTREMVDAAPWPLGNAAAGGAGYGALARDGVSCTTCHRIALGERAAAVRDAPQNRCVAGRQALLNPHNTGFARTFTGSFLVGGADQLGGPFAEPKTTPMRNAIGSIPVHDRAVSSSEVCGACHTVHLPVLRDGQTIGSTYEQATYAEWAFSAYRTGSTPDGPLPGGAGPLAQSCQGCHMPSRDADGRPTRSKIAGILEVNTFPQVENRLPASEIDLPVREGYAQHVLVGLNLFLVKMADQFSGLLGTAAEDPMLAKHGLSPTAVTELAIVDQAMNRSVDIAVRDVMRADGVLSAVVTVRNKTGHRFPSGVGFRRAFIGFEVLDASGAVIWASGRTNAAGMLVDETGQPLAGEQWWTEDCGSRIAPEARLHQPHRPVVTRQDEVQVYEELVAAPPAAGPAQCGRHAAPSGPLTTSFLSICAPVKDNRLTPEGFLPLPERVAISRALGAGEDLAVDAAPIGVENDPGFTADGSSVVRYRVPLAGLAGADAVRATVYYQATPPYYLQDRMCTSRSADTRRLAVIAGGLDLAGSQAEGWKLRMSSTGVVKVGR